MKAVLVALTREEASAEQPATAAPAAGCGLTQAEAARRLAAEGPNALAATQRRGIFRLLWRVASEPMFVLLAVASATYLVLGDLGEAAALAASILVVFAITVTQERRTERTLERLRDLSSPRAVVIRDGVQRRIEGEQVVPGDILVVHEGARVAADARVLESHDLEADESMLTGESVPVPKSAASDAQIFSGTLIVRGSGRALVIATGAGTELGRIGAAVARVDPGKTSLQVETTRIVRYVAGAAAALCAAVIGLYIATQRDIVDAILAALTLAMSLLPEEFPVVLTIFLALGAWRIARHGVLTRRMAAIEMLGSATVLCCDKTGTLTQNRMEVTQVWAAGEWASTRQLPPDHAGALATAAHACDHAPYDPMERAILAAVAPGTDASGARPVERHYPLSDAFLAVATVRRNATGGLYAALKGAPETVTGVCRMPREQRQAVLAAVAAAADRGLRVLAIARASSTETSPPRDARSFAWEFAGLVALADPLRPGVPQAIGLCGRAGIRIVMITGDHPATARAVGRQAGLDVRRIMTGGEVEALSPVARAQAVREVQVFARVRPEQKLALVQAFRAAGEVVAMTGDGVNDAPALKAAHIGVAMGVRGTDVAREAAALVLLEDDFTALVATVRLGRRIYDNIRSAMSYLVAVHVPLAGMALLPLAAGWPVFLYPLHVVFLEFVIDPACTLAFEAEHSDPEIMRRHPRPPGERLFTRAMLAASLALGATCLAAVFAVYGIALAHGVNEAAARTLGFTTLLSSNLALILAYRSSRRASGLLARPNVVAWSIVAAAGAALVAVTHWGAAAALFRFERPALAAQALAAVAGVGVLAFVAVAKRWAVRNAPALA